MAHWSEVEAADPAFAARVRTIFEGRKHHTIATLRRDGSPRISGIEIAFTDGDVVVGMMPGSRKQDDVLRDPRVAMHALSDDPRPGDQGKWRGDAKISGRAIAPPARPQDEPPGTRFMIDIDEVVVTRLDDPTTHLLIESWHPGRGMETRRRT